MIKEHQFIKIFIDIRGDGSFLKARQGAKKGELDEQLREYINEWRKQRAKEEDELKRLKEKQAKRKEIRAEQEKKLAQQKVNKQLTFANKLLPIFEFCKKYPLPTRTTKPKHFCCNISR